MFYAISWTAWRKASASQRARFIVEPPHPSAVRVLSADRLARSISWKQVLTQMAVNTPWQSAYDPMRAVNGEVGNAFTPTGGALTITP